MAILTNETQTYDVTGNREDLNDEISIITPVDAPFYNGCAAGAKPISVKVEWQIDAIRAGATNSAVEGDQVASTLTDLVATSRASNYVQIQKIEYAVSATQDWAKHAGTSTESAHQKMKNLKALTQDIEYAFLQEVLSTTSSGAGDATHARKMKGALNWCTTNVDKAGDASVASDGTITGGTARALDETLVKNICQNIFTSGGNPSIAFCGPFQKMQVSGFSQATSNYRTAVEGSKLNATVDVYVNDFFTLTIKPHRGMPTDVLFVPDMNFWKKRTARPVGQSVLSSTVDGNVYRILVEHTLESTNEAASGRITNLTTS